MGNVSINVYAINSSANTPFRVEGIDLATIKKVMSTWDNYGNWIGSNKPSNYQSINSQLVVAKDAISNDTDNYYDNRTLEELIPEFPIVFSRTVTTGAPVLNANAPSIPQLLGVVPVATNIVSVSLLGAPTFVKSHPEYAPGLFI